MKIGFVVDQEVKLTARFLSGEEKTIGLLCEGLQDRGHQVFVLTNDFIKHKAQTVLYDQRTDCVYENPLVQTVNNLILSINKLLKENLDILNNHSGNPLVLIISNQLDIPVVTTLHKPLLPIFRDGILALFGEHNQKFTSSNQRIRKSYQSLLSNVKNIKIGIKVEEWKQYEKHSEAYFSWAGRIRREKNLVEIIQHCLESESCFKIAGPIIDHDYWQEEIKPLIESNRLISYEGELSHEDLNRLIGESAAFIYGTTLPSSYGLTFVEALACGTPVIRMINPEFPFEIDESVTVKFTMNDGVSFATAISTVSEIEREACRKKALQTYNLRNMIDQFEQYYAELIAVSKSHFIKNT